MGASADDAAGLECGDIRGAVAELGENLRAVLTHLRRGSCNPGLDATESQRQVAHLRGALESRIIPDRGQEAHGSHLRIVERLLRSEDRTCGDTGLLEDR